MSQLILVAINRVVTGVFQLLFFCYICLYYLSTINLCLLLGSWHFTVFGSLIMFDYYKNCYMAAR